MDKSRSKIERWDTSHERWFELMSLKDVEDLDLETRTGYWHLGTYTLVAINKEVIVGVLRFWTQEIGTDEDKLPFFVDGQPAVEAKIVAFHVLDEYRQQGIGRALQLAAVRWARELNCYQVRSRSSYNRRANHLLKASLGFGISPGRNSLDGPDDTAYFVLPLRLSNELIDDGQ